MDIFKFHNPTSPTKLEVGEIINGLKSKMWVERYREAGEFSLESYNAVDIREKLPVGTLISHTGSKDVMIVENHEIVEEKGSPPEIIVSGRSFETFGENRIVGSNKSFPTSTGVQEYSTGANPTWDQATNLLLDHLVPAALIDPDDGLPYITIAADVADTGVEEARSFKRDNLYSTLIKLLGIDDLGIRVIRPGPWSPLGASDPNLLIQIHKGVDRRSNIVFSHSSGEIERADYLWSSKKLKNTAMVSGKWVETLVTTTETGYDRRMLYVDAKDIDESYDVAPTGSDLTNVIQAMQARGAEALADQNHISLSKIELTRNAIKAGYRTDFDVGDLITVIGGYDISSVRRISEYVEIEDSSGARGYPTLTVVE